MYTRTETQKPPSRLIMMGKVTKYRDYRVVHLDQGDSLVETDGGHGAGAARGGAGEKRSAQKWPLSADQPRPMAGRTTDNILANRGAVTSPQMPGRRGHYVVIEPAPHCLSLSASCNRNLPKYHINHEIRSSICSDEMPRRPITSGGRNGNDDRAGLYGAIKLEFKTCGWDVERRKTE